MNLIYGQTMLIGYHQPSYIGAQIHPDSTIEELTAFTTYQVPPGKPCILGPRPHVWERGDL